MSTVSREESGDAQSSWMEKTENVRRERQLSEKGKDYYVSWISWYNNKLNAVEKKIDQETTDPRNKDLLEYKQTLISLGEEYKSEYTQFIEFLVRNQCALCDGEKTIAQDKAKKIFDYLSRVIEELDKHGDHPERQSEETQNGVKSDEYKNETNLKSDVKSKDNKSVKSGHSVKSKQSRRSSLAASEVSSLARQKAKVEAARVKFKFAQKDKTFKEKQAELEKENLNIKAERELLDAQKELAMAEAEYNVYKEEEEEEDISFKSAESLEQTKQKRTEMFVNDCGSSHVIRTTYKTSPTENKIKVPQTHWQTSLTEIEAFVPGSHWQTGPRENAAFMAETCWQSDLKENNGTGNEKLDCHRQNGDQDFVPWTHCRTGLDKQANFSQIPNEDKFPNTHTNQSLNFVASNQSFVEFSKYLMRKELLVTRLSPFNDEPGCFPTWKQSFLGIINELELNDREHLDLLVKYLGPKSAEQARSLRNSNPNDPTRAVHRIWERLNDRYAKPELVESAIRLKIDKFPRIEKQKEFSLLYDLLDIVTEIESMKCFDEYKALLGMFDTSIGVNQILQKLPYGLQQKWFDQASRYKQTYKVPYPPFDIFVSFIRDLSIRCNDPGLCAVANNDNSVKKQSQTQRLRPVTVFKTDIENRLKSSTEPQPGKEKYCPLHGRGHSLTSCRAFRSKSMEERKKILKDEKLCYRCCQSAHSFRDCKTELKCRECESSNHCSAMHVSKPNPLPSTPNNGGEAQGPQSNNPEILSKCTALCSKTFGGRSCAKTILVKIFTPERPDRYVVTYAVHDDQSNKSLGSPGLFNQLGVGGETHQFSLSSCGGNTKIHSRLAKGLTVQSLDGSYQLDIPTLIECDVPNDRSEIPTPEVTRYFPHLSSLETVIPPLDPDAEIGLLIGRDVIEAHRVERQIVGPRDQPFAQKLPLGWAVIGEVCLGQFHKPNLLNAFKTQVFKGDRPSILSSCNNTMCIKENMMPDYCDGVFRITSLDERVGMSQDDYAFIDLMDKEMIKDKDGHWEAPLPFKSPRQPLPNNRALALKRARSLDFSLKKNPRKQEHMVEFMQQIFDSRAAEIAPFVPDGDECWYLPLFGVYHPRKLDKIRGVFDSSVEFKGHSLNKVLLSGPNLTNSLLGVLLRFRRNKVAIATDIQQMFYSFLVEEKHRDFLRFLWYENNDPAREMIEYRMRVHVFGNTPSPAVATFGLRKTVSNADKDVQNFVNRDFYVDDGLTSCTSVQQAVDLVKRAQFTLFNEAKIRLHKIVSNNPEVMAAFPPDDLEKNLKSVDIFADELPMQASLGLSWNLNKDVFVFKLDIPDKPATKRGILSAVSSLFDPLGFLSPVTIQGKMIIREAFASCEEWDEPLNEQLQSKWESWRISLGSADRISFPRMFCSVSWDHSDSKRIHIFADASEKAISTVAYLQLRDQHEVKVGFLMGKSKLAPPAGTTIPRLELCAAVLATELAEIIIEQLDFTKDDIVYHSDSRVVLGYLNNRSRRFYTYVSNRVQAILRSSNAGQWHYVSTQQNPADLGTRGVTNCQDLSQSIWCTGPSFLKGNSPCQNKETSSSYSLVDENTDKELRPEITTRATVVSENIVPRFERFSTLSSLIRAFSWLKRVCRAKHTRTSISKRSVPDDEDTLTYLIKTVQEDAFSDKTKWSIDNLNPFLDGKGVLRVGGRLRKANTEYQQQHPIIVPKRSHLAKLLINHFHTKVHHQGRLITEAAIRSGGYWIIGAKRIVSFMLHSCVTCRKLRRRGQIQCMADLPRDRVTQGPPFSSVGIDTFGPWMVSARKTRGGLAESKRWAILFTCLATRAVHIEVVENMDSSAFINALRRFVAIRGPIKELRSDRGTNFIGALDHVKANGIFVENGPVHEHLHSNGITWYFNPPHSSHMGGAWERLIGIARKILDAMLLNTQSQTLTHDTLCTFMHEVSAIINSRPIGPIPYDPDNPEIITPAMLLTQKNEPLHGLTTSLNLREMYESQWKHVQILSNTFWKRWREGYLQSLQTRRKWTKTLPNLKPGDVVLLCDKELHRNNWPLGLIVKVFPSDCDKLVRSVEVRVFKGDKSVHYVRPISDVILLVEST